MLVEASSLFTETEGQLRERVDDENKRDDSEDYAVDVDAGKRWRRGLVASRALSFPSSGQVRSRSTVSLTVTSRRLPNSPANIASTHAAAARAEVREEPVTN